MEELKAYLQPASIAPAPLGVAKQASLQGRIASLHHKGVALKAGDIVILGVNESRNSPAPQVQNSPNTIRRYLYALSAPSSSGSIVDAGNIVETSTPAQTYSVLEHVLELLLPKKVTLVMLGGTQELTECIYKGYRRSQNLLTLSIADSHIDLDDDGEDFHSLNYLNRLIKENPLSLFDLSFIGYQGYFVDSAKLDRVRNLNHELLRLGFVRGNPREVEPTLRNSDIVSLDMGAIRSSDSPCNPFPSPNGLYAEEACQLARYAGAGERASCFGIFEYAPDGDPTGQSALLAAQLAWHFIEGTAQRSKDGGLEHPENTQKFIVSSGTPGVDLVFYRNQLSERWWFELPAGSAPTRRLAIPCSPTDYAQAGRQEIPERWLRFLQKAQALKNSGT